MHQSNDEGERGQEACMRPQRTLCRKHHSTLCRPESVFSSTLHLESPSFIALKPKFHPPFPHTGAVSAPNSNPNRVLLIQDIVINLPACASSYLSPISVRGTIKGESGSAPGRFLRLGSSHHPPSHKVDLLGLMNGQRKAPRTAVPCKM